jgi:hypothetical protein
MTGWNYTPSKAPLVPKPVRSFHSPKTPDESTWGFPPRSHRHISRRVPTRNEEPPLPQVQSDDFRKVLRKKHAIGAHLTTRMTVVLPVNYRRNSIP